MKLFYTCFGAAHSSVTAANIHLGLLPSGRRATYRELYWQPMFDRAHNWDMGLPLFMGQDERGVEVYVLGLAGGHRHMPRALADFLEYFGHTERSFRFENTLAHVSLLMRIGGFTSRRIGLTAVGRPLVTYATRLRYDVFTAHVTRVKAQVHQQLESDGPAETVAVLPPTQGRWGQRPPLP